MVSNQKRRIGPVTQSTGAAAAVSLVLCWILSHFFGIEVPYEVESALVVIAVFAAGYAVKPKGRHEA